MLMLSESAPAAPHSIYFESAPYAVRTEGLSSSSNELTSVMQDEFNNPITSLQASSIIASSTACCLDLKIKGTVDGKAERSSSQPKLSNLDD